MKLIVFDVEGTIFEAKNRLKGTSIDSTIWQGIAHALGRSAIEEEVNTHKKWENGEYENYIDWMKETIAIHIKYGLTKSTFYKLITSAKYNPKVPETIAQIDRSRYELILISGGFRELAARAQRDLKIPHAFAACEYFFGNHNRIEYFNLLPCDFRGKIDFIELMLKEYGLKNNDWIFVGDGKNDVVIAQHSMFSIGYRAHPELRKVATRNIENFHDLIDLLM